MRFTRALSARAPAVVKPKPIRTLVCSTAQMAHQETKIVRSLPEEKGDFAILQQLQHFVGAELADMAGAPVCQLDVSFGIVRLLDAGIHLRAIEHIVETIQLADIDEFPLDQLSVMVVEPVLFLFPKLNGFRKRLLFVVCCDQAELFVKLRRVPAFTADDLKDDLGKIPVHTEKVRW